MHNEFPIPARPWTEADVAFLTHNADFLPQEIRDELGLTPAIPDNSFRADYDAAKEVVPPAVETGEVVPNGLIGTGMEVSEPEFAEPTLPTDTVGEVVNNDATDNA
jgi:hypothetical protein